MTPVTDRSTETLRLDKARLEESIHVFLMGCDRRTAADHAHEQRLRADRLDGRLRLGVLALPWPRPLLRRPP